MIRYAMKNLTAWKERKNHKPLIIRGARQVGKTWIMKEFGRTHYEKVAYINCDNNERMVSLFQGDLDIRRLILALQIETGVTIEAHNTLIIFDEVQEVPRALTSLKYFHENAPEYSIVAAGSLLGVALHPGTSFPVGKVEFLDLYPLSFTEFLEAAGNKNLVDLLHTKDFSLITTFKNKFIDMLRQYYYVGGMPEAVAAFAQNNDFAAVREIQKRLLYAYEQDFSKHAPSEIVPRIRMVWNSISAQLAKENRKFIYGQLRQGARAKEFELAIHWLLDCGLIRKVCRITKPDMPLIAYQEYSTFKLFMVDVGLLAAMSGLDLKSLLEGNRVFKEFKGALTEQYVMQQLFTDSGITPFYWTADRSSAEIDFVFQHGNDIVPVEVKAEENLRAKSLKSYCQKYLPRYAVRTSMSDFRKEEWLINVPLYAIGTLSEILE
jgi:predicted AAA+ superfamily ATPase